LGDLTAALLPEDATGRAAFMAREEGVIAGALSVNETYGQLDPQVKLTWMADDGIEVSEGECVARVEGPLASMLTGERTALNFLCHLSGVATLTRRFVRATHGRARIWDTRKTTPGLRALEKAAVRAGGGVNHRGTLSDFVLVKDNHLAGLGITEAVRRSRAMWPGRTVEVECDRIGQVREALSAGAEMVLLDNMSPPDVRACVGLVRASPVPGLLVEVSGGITLDNVRAYADAGADLVSTSVITQSAPAL